MTKREQGKVKWFNQKKGFGFIEREQGDNIFAHNKCIRNGGHGSLMEGQRVEFNVVKTQKGFQAEDILVIERSVLDVLQSG